VAATALDDDLVRRVDDDHATFVRGDATGTHPGEHVEKPPVLPPVLLALMSDNLMEVLCCSVGDLFVS
jgi:hypothetical protein